MKKGVDRLSFLRRRGAAGMRDNPGDAIDVSTEDEDRERRDVGRAVVSGVHETLRDNSSHRSSYGDRPTRARLSGRDASGAHSYLKYGTKMVNMG